MLEVRGLSASGEAGTVVRDVSLTVAAGEAVAVLGPNGAGKTTLLRTVCGVRRATSGSVRFDGEEVLGTGTAALARRGLVLVPAERNLFPRMSVAENLALGAYPDRPDRRVLAEVHELFPRLAERATQRAGTMSGGEQQMLAVGRALMGRPRLLVLDEPSTGLSPRLAGAAFRALAVLRDRGMAVLVAEQQVPLALGLASRAYVVEDGTVQVEGPADQVASDDRVRRVYLGIG